MSEPSEADLDWTYEYVCDPGCRSAWCFADIKCWRECDRFLDALYELELQREENDG